MAIKPTPIKPLDAFLPVEPGMDTDEVLKRLRINALSSHQQSVGQGDALVQILQRAITQLEKTHSRIQNMSTVLFIAGLALLAAGVFQVLFGHQGQEVWGALLGGVGGISSMVAVFWTAPLDKMSDSVADLVKLETAFLGYIRVIGELDSSFQMQYLDSLTGQENLLPLDRVVTDTVAQVREMMDATLNAIDAHVVGPGSALAALKKQTEAMEIRLKAIESNSAPPTGLG